MPKIRVFMDVGLCGCDREEDIEIDDELWNNMTDAEKEEELNEQVEVFKNNYLDYGAYVVEDKENG